MNELQLSAEVSEIFGRLKKIEDNLSIKVDTLKECTDLKQSHIEITKQVK